MIRLSIERVFALANLHCMLVFGVVEGRKNLDINLDLTSDAFYTPNKPFLEGASRILDFPRVVACSIESYLEAL